MPDYKLRIIVEGEDRASRPLSGIAGSLGRIAEFTAGNLLASGIEKVFSGATQLAGGLVSVTGEAAALNAQLSETQALSGATAGEVATLKDLIYDLGIDPSLKVTATEAAGAVNMLVRNGLSLDEVMDGAARSTVLLANSTGADFGQAADIATNAMAIFGLEAENMGAAVDSITGVVNNSQFSIQDYNMALAQGGAAANVAGMSLEEFNAGIVAISSNFASGSDAGTSFKTMVQRLVPQSDEASAAMQALGLSFFEADGSMKDVAEIGGELNRVFEGQVNFSREVGGRTAEQNAELQRLNRIYNSTTASINDYAAGIKGANYTDEQRSNKVAELQGKLEAINAEREKLLGIQGDLVTTTRALTEEEKIHYLQTIFGTDAMRAAAAMAGYTEEEINALYDTLGETDAELAAARRMDNLAGDMEVFGGVIETVRLQIGDRFQPAARAFVQSVTTIAEAAAPAALAAADAMSAWIQPYVDAFSSQITASIDAAEAAFAEFSPDFGIAAGLAAATGAATGATVDVTANVLTITWSDTLSYTFDAEANVHSLNWGDTSFSFDAIANVISVSRPNFDYKLDVTALVGSIDWTSAAGDQLNYVYDADAEVVKVRWLPAGGGVFHYVYSADAGIQRIQWLNADNLGFTYDANARITQIDWTYRGAEYSYTYDAEAEITKLNWMGETFNVQNKYQAIAEIIRIEWNALKEIFTYDAEAGITSVKWNGETYSGVNAYDAIAEIFRVNWGFFRGKYSADAEVPESGVNWGVWSNIYDAGAEVGESDVSWGAWSTEYAAGATVSSVNWGQHTHTYTARVRIEAVSEAAAGALNDAAAGLGGLLGGLVPGQAVGTANWRGGLVKVHRDELLSLPRGTRIYNKSESQQLAGAGGGISIGNVTINNDMDQAEFEARLQRALYQRR